MSIVMRAWDIAPRDGRFLKSFDFDANNGLGYAEFTSDPKEALSFPSVERAFNFYRTQSTVRPLREDGKPNRPLTGVTWDFVSPEDGQKTEAEIKA